MKNSKRKVSFFLMPLFLLHVIATTSAMAVGMPENMDMTIAAGLSRSFVIQPDGTLWAWGGNNHTGALGDGTTTNRYTPTMILNDVVSISAGQHHTAAIRTDGSLYTWGHNRWGQLGDSTTENRYNPQKILDDVVYVSAGYSHTAAIRSDGSLWIWGRNFRGKLGDGTTIDRHYPIKIMDNVTAVALGNFYTMAIKTDGSLWAWGNNDAGQIAGTTNANWYYATPQKIMNDVIAVSAGSSHVLSIKSDGSLYTWGSNHFGELGDGTTISHIPIRIMDNVVQASAGDGHTAAVKTDGSLWVWGLNSYGQVGDGTISGRYTGEYIAEGVPGFIIFHPGQLTPVKIMDDVAEVSAGGSHTMAIKTDGSLWAWGANHAGQLGDGTTIDQHTPLRIIDSVIISEPESTSVHSVVTARPSSHLVLVDGESISFQAFLVGDNNFFMLRDIAYALNGSTNQFEVSWDEKLLAINLTTGEPYTPVGGEMASAEDITRDAIPSMVAVYVNGNQVELRAYLIGDNNFFMLRDLGAALGFSVNWNEYTRTILVK